MTAADTSTRRPAQALLQGWPAVATLAAVFLLATFALPWIPEGAARWVTAIAWLVAAASLARAIRSQRPPASWAWTLLVVQALLLAVAFALSSSSTIAAGALAAIAAGIALIAAVRLYLVPSGRISTMAVADTVITATAILAVAAFPAAEVALGTSTGAYQLGELLRALTAVALVYGAWRRSLLPPAYRVLISGYAIVATASVVWTLTPIGSADASTIALYRSPITALTLVIVGFLALAPVTEQAKAEVRTSLTASLWERPSVLVLLVAIPAVAVVLVPFENLDDGARNALEITVAVSLVALLVRSIVARRARDAALRRAAEVLHTDRDTGFPNLAGLRAQAETGILPDGRVAAILLEWEHVAMVAHTRSPQVTAQVMREWGREILERFGPRAWIGVLGPGSWIVVLPFTSGATSLSDLAERAHREYSVDAELGGVFRIRPRVGAVTGSATSASQFDAMISTARLAAADPDPSLRIGNASTQSRWRRRVDIAQGLLAPNFGGGLRVEGRLVVSAATRQPVCLDLVPIWAHPVLGPVRENEFREEAWNAGVGDQLELEITAHGLRWAAEHPGAAVSTLLDPRTVLEAASIGDLTQAARNLNLEPQQVWLNLPRGLEKDSRHVVSDRLRMLREAGYLIFVDRIGAGEGSLGRVTEEGISGLRTHHSIPERLKDRRTLAIVSAIGSMARSLDLMFVVDGIADEQQARLATSLGATHLVGPLFGAPQPLERISLD